jgi:hypothetical protein
MSTIAPVNAASQGAAYIALADTLASAPSIIVDEIVFEAEEPEPRPWNRVAIEVTSGTGPHHCYLFRVTFKRKPLKLDEAGEIVVAD